MECQCFWPSLQEKANVGIFLGRGGNSPFFSAEKSLDISEWVQDPSVPEEKICSHWQWKVGAFVPQGCPSSTPFVLCPRKYRTSLQLPASGSRYPSVPQTEELSHFRSVFLSRYSQAMMNYPFTFPHNTRQHQPPTLRCVSSPAPAIHILQLLLQLFPELSPIKELPSGVPSGAETEGTERSQSQAPCAPQVSPGCCCSLSLAHISWVLLLITFGVTSSTIPLQVTLISPFPSRAPWHLQHPLLCSHCLLQGRRCLEWPEVVGLMRVTRLMQ